MDESEYEKEFMDLAQKLIALYNIYLTPMRKILTNYKEIVNDILNGTRKIETDFNLMVNKFFNAIINEPESEPNNVPSFERKSSEKRVETSEYHQTAEKLIGTMSGTLVGGGPPYESSTVAAAASASSSTTSLGSSSVASASTSASTASTTGKLKNRIL